MDKQLKAIVVEVLREFTVLEEVKPEEFKAWIEEDWEFSPKEAQKVLTGEEEGFSEENQEIYTDLVMATENDVESIVKKHWPSEVGDFDDVEDEVQSILQDIVDYELRTHPMDKKMDMNVCIDAGDWDTEYASNGWMYDDDEIPEESGLLWLVRQQGYSKDDLWKAIHQNPGERNPFFRSLIQEAVDITSTCNALTLCVSASINDLMKVKEGTHQLVVPKEARCGLWDNWQGAGGTINIAMDKDVRIGKENIDIHVEGASGYGLQSIYGSRDFWEVDASIEPVEQTV